MTNTAVPAPEHHRTDVASVLAREIRSQIEAGQWRPGEILPSAQAIADLLPQAPAVSMVRRAIDQLRHAGVLAERTDGQGVMVPPPTDRLSIVRNVGKWGPIEKERARIEDPERRGSYGASEEFHGVEMSALTFEATYHQEPLPAKVADRFSVEAGPVEMGTPALRRHYVTRWVKTGQPSGISDSWLLRADIEMFPPLLDAANEPWPGATQHQLREVGIEVARIEQRHQARPATLAEVREMTLPEYGWVLATEKRLIDTRDLVVEVAYVVMDARVTTNVEAVELEPWPMSHNDEADAAVRLMRRGRDRVR